MGALRVARDVTPEEALRVGMVATDARLVWVDETADRPTAYGWTLADPWTRATRRCRHTLTGAGRAQCRDRPVAVLWRPSRTARHGLTSSAYCHQHLYGRIIEGGRILAIHQVVS